MKTKLLYLLFGLGISLITTAQAPGWSWAQSAATNTISGSGLQSLSAGANMATDAGGNIIVTGEFEGPSITFGNTTLTTTTMGNHSVRTFIVKYDASGSVLWAKLIGAPNSLEISGISTDAGGNILLTGFFSSSTLALGSATLTNAGSSDIFIARLDASGNVLWAKSHGTALAEWSTGISTDGNGNIFTAGFFSGPDLAIGSTTLTNSTSQSDIYIAKYDALGNALWATRFEGGFSTYNSNYIKTDASGNIFLTGTFFNSINLGNNITLTNPTANNLAVFLAKFDATGHAIWARDLISNLSDNMCNGMSIDLTGNTFITGVFASSSLTLGSITLTNTAGSNNYEAFVAKYDAAGNVLWAKSIGGTGPEHAQGICTDAGGNAFVTGFSSSPVLNFGSTTTVSTHGDLDLYIARYDASGNLIWAEASGGSYDDGAFAICTDAGGAVYIMGAYQSTAIAFGSTTLTNNNPISTLPNGMPNPNGRPYGDFFIAKMDNGTPTGLKENKAAALTIFPNPFSTQVMVQADQPLKEATLTLVNSLGQTVKQVTNISTQTISIFRGDLGAGIYFMHVLQEDKIIFTKKLIITD